MPDPAARHGPGTPGPGNEHGTQGSARGPQGSARGPSPDAATDPGHRQGPHASGTGALLTTFVARLREAGLDPDVERICDALWLARWTGQGQGPSQDGSRTSLRNGPGAAPEQSRDIATAAAGDGRGAAAPPREPPPPGRPAGEDPRIALYPVPRGGGPRERDTGPAGGVTAFTLGVPAAPALPAPLELQRALRPLQRYRPAAPPVRRSLDEAATAELSARAGGTIIPVFRGVQRADALLQLVMDASSSMRVWDRLFADMQLVFSQLGAFWDVQTRYVHQGPDGAPAVSRSPDPAAAPLSSADRLSDPTGRRVTLVISDCAGPLWHSGRAQRLLHQLGSQAPTAVLQPLPQRMWNRTRLPVSYGVLSRGEGLSGAAVLNVTESGPARPVHPGALAIPVLQPATGALGAWARLLSGTGSGRISGAVGWVRSDHPAAPAPVPGRRMSSLQLVSRFRSAASPVAGRLAVYLAAAPLYLPVMQLVQRTMLPDSGPSELAEVLLSGLLSRTKGDGTEDGAAWYEFLPGVQDALLGPLGRDEALLVLKHCSEYIEQRFGRSGPNFPALAFAQLGDATRGPLHPGAGEDDGYNGEGGAAGPRVPHPFAEVAARVLERFMPLPEQFAHYGDRGRQAEDRSTNSAVESARGLLRRFESDSMVQYLIDAVQLLRGATEREEPIGSDPELWAEYARCLLRLWEVQGGGGLLRDAERAAERAAAHPHAVRERAVLARVLHVSADDRRRRGDNRGALELLRRADREYTFACAAPGLDPGEALRLTLERVRALEAQWRLGGDSALLQGAVGMLEAFADVWPDQGNRPAGLPLAHGRTLLRLAGATGDAQQAQVYAGQAARSLRGALTRGGSQHTVGGRARVLLDLLDALLLSGDSLDEAATLVGQALETVADERQASSLRIRAGRIRVARYEDSGDARELQEAAEWFGLAKPGIPRDSPAHADLLDEWGRTLLRRAELPGGTPYIGPAVRVLRDCRTETENGAARQASRLLMLGQALMLRHRGNDDRVDLREAEHLFGVAARQSREPLTTARCWLELGLSHLDASRSLHRPARLDEAAEAFRAAADAARTAEADEERPRDRVPAVRLRAEANHWRGSTYEAAGRPRAARDAYRAALAEWRKLPDGGGEAARMSGDRLAELERGEFNGRTSRQPG